jgi:hypothetical protein
MASRAYKANYALIDFSKDITVPPKARPLGPRSSLTCPYVVSDTMDPVQSQLDGRMYTSKSRLRETYRAAGVVEVGNDPARFAKPKKPKPDRKAIRESLLKAKARLNS